MTQPTNERPSDEVTAKVVCLWKNEKREVFKDDGRLRRAGIWVTMPDGSGIIEHISEDPRTDTDAALELLWYVTANWCSGGVFPQMNGSWHVNAASTNEPECDVFIPVFGPEFRHAVVRLAAQCLGVEDE